MPPYRLPIMAHVIALMVVGSTIALEGMYLFYGGMSKVDPVVVGRVLGTMDSALIMVLAFYFGSSSASARQTEIIANATPSPTPSAADAPVQKQDQAQP